MKYISILLFILATSMGYSQSVTEKYNSLYKRYEYFDVSGNLIGYKTYNSLLKQWEYYENVNSRRKTDYGNYVNPVDLNLVQSTLQNRQARYDKNRQLVENYVVDLSINITNSYESQAKGEYVANLFFKEIEQEQIFSKIDFSNSSLTNAAIKRIKTLYYYTIRKAEN